MRKVGQSQDLRVNDAKKIFEVKKFRQKRMLIMLRSWKSKLRYVQVKMIEKIRRRLFSKLIAK